MAILVFLFAQERRKAADGLLGVDRTGGVVRGVDDDRLGVLADALRKGVEVDLEILDGRRNEHAFRACAALDEHLILREEGREYDELVPLARERTEGAHERGSRACGQIQAVAGVVRAETAVKAVRERSAYVRRTRRGGIAVDHDRIACGLRENSLTHLIRRRHVRIAERKVEDIFASDDRGTLIAVFKDLTNGRAVTSQLVHLSVYHRYRPFQIGFIITQLYLSVDKVDFFTVGGTSVSRPA